MIEPSKLELGGERFTAVYHLAGAEAEARALADDLCVEQTVEFPPDLLPDGPIKDHVVGRVEDFGPRDGGGYRALVSFAIETVGSELTQLLNVLFGNTSLKHGVRVERLDLPPGLLARFRGPRLGRRGLRQLLGAPERPLLCTALKPMGLSPAELATMARRPTDMAAHVTPVQDGRYATEDMRQMRGHGKI